ncbi:ABC transporter substrate-binding protein [Patescibacteria group bacterium]
MPDLPVNNQALGQDPPKTGEDSLNQNPPAPPVESPKVNEVVEPKDPSAPVGNFSTPPGSTPPASPEALKTEESLPSPSLPPLPVQDKPGVVDPGVVAGVGGGVPTAEPQTFHSAGRSPGSVIKKIVPLLIILVVAAGIVYAVSRYFLPQVSEIGFGKKELVYWGLWESEGVMETVLSEWEEESGVKVLYEYHHPREYRQRLQTALAKGEGPDIFRFHNSWTPMLKNDLDAVPASVMNAATFENTYYPVAQASLKSGAGYLGIPLEIDTLALFYNQDIFTAARVSPPRTWDELRRLAIQLTVRDGQSKQIQRAGVSLGTTGNIWHWSDILGLMMLQNGAKLNNPTGPLAEDALSFYALFSKTDKVWDETLPDSLTAFAMEKSAMCFGYSWSIFEILNVNPNLNFKVIPVPQLSETDITWASFWVEGVSKNSPNKTAAWDFLKFLSSEETMEKLYQSQSKVRLFGEPYSRVSMASKLEDDPMVFPFISQASKAESWYLSSRTFDNGINDSIIEYFADAVNSVSQRSSAKGALSTVAKGVRQILSKYGLPLK